MLDPSLLDDLQIAVIIIETSNLTIRESNTYAKDTLEAWRGAALDSILPVNGVRLRRKLGRGKEFTGVAETSNNDGSTHLYSVTARVREDEPGTALITVSDLAAAQERLALYRSYAAAAQDNLQRLETRLAAFPAANPSPVLATDATGRITYANPASSKVLEELGQKSLNALLHEQHPSFVARALEGMDTVVEYGIAGRLFEFQYQGLPDQGVVHIYGRELTQIRAAEQRLSQATRLEALGLLAGGIAHDFNNILGIVLGYSKLLLTDEALTAEHRNSITYIVQAAERASSITEQITAFSRNESGERAAFALASLFEDALRLMRKWLPASTKVNLQISEESARHAVVWGDAGKLNQILFNLVSNANLALEGLPGTITIAVTASAKSKNVDWSVHDTGCGMNETVLAHLFEPYFTTRAKTDGSGLGLSVVHGLVREHSGTIRVQSTLGSGSLFELTFPRCLDAAVNVHSDAQSQDKKKVGTHKRRVMVVDDEPMLVRLITRMLKRQGHKVKGFEDPRSALEAFATAPDDFDLLLTDQSMPHLTGTELTQRLLAIRSDLPVIICSGYGLNSDDPTKTPEGTRATLAKPIDWPRLYELVRTV